MNRLLNYWLATKPEIEYYQCTTSCSELEVCEHYKLHFNVSGQLVKLCFGFLNPPCCPSPTFLSGFTSVFTPGITWWPQQRLHPEMHLNN